MNQAATVQKYFQRKHLLTIHNASYTKQLDNLFFWLLAADDIKHDATLPLLSKGKTIANIISKQAGVIGGVDETLYLIKKHTSLTPLVKVKDRDKVKPSQIIIQIHGNAQDLLIYERAILNILGRMSGIATETNKLISKLPKDFFIAATRKTPFMGLDKKAVAVGGGLTHRLSLSDWPLVKDNHLRILQKQLNLSIENAIIHAVTKLVHKNIEFFEIEVESKTQAKIALEVFIKEVKKCKSNTQMALLLDNLTPETAAKTIQQLRIQLRKAVPCEAIFEASGGITRENMREWAKTGVDLVSLGSLTHSAKNFDLSMEIN